MTIEMHDIGVHAAFQPCCAVRSLQSYLAADTPDFTASMVMKGASSLPPITQPRKLCLPGAR